MPKATRILRELRGGTRPCLLATDDGCAYVVKSAGNPRSRRILVNEWIGSSLLQQLGIATPDPALVYTDDDLAAAIAFGARGWHFGSKYPMNVASFDAVPDSVLARVENLQDFAGALVVDKWMGNTDMRQCIFVRDRIGEYLPHQAQSQRKGFVALMIDQDHMFNGPRWEYLDSTMYGLYFRPAVYRSLPIDVFDYWIARVQGLSDEVLSRIVSQIPGNWLESTQRGRSGDAAALHELLHLLMTRRRHRLADLVLRSARNKSTG